MAAIPYEAQERTEFLQPPPSKLRPPAMGVPFMPRERLINRVREAEWAKLVVVQAPAGFGTTTLLRHMYDTFLASGSAIAWLTLDADDNDLERLMVCLGQAFAQMGCGRGDAAASEAFDLASALTSTPLPFMLIIDEFEHLHNPASLAVVQQLIEMIGPRQQVIIGSREQPGLSLGRLRARRQLLEIDAAELRFSLDESLRFLRDKRGLVLDSQDIEHLHKVTGGWAAALWLSSLALERSDDPKRFIRTFSGSNTVVASYLAEAVLSHRPRYLQDFILQTSILDKFCADSCNAVTGRSDSRLLLEEIERSNMFMTAEDEQRSWFRYHPLFSGFLRARLERQSPGLAPVLHRRAALWFDAQGRTTQAIDHAITSGDQELVLSLLGQHAEALFLHGRVRLLARWFDALGREALAAHPKLGSVYAWSLIHTNRSGEALSLLESIGADKNVPLISRSNYLVLKTLSLFMLDRTEETADMWDDPDILGDTTREPLLRSMLKVAGAYYYSTVGRYADARRLLDRATQQSPAIGPLFSVTVAAYVHAMLDLMQGHLRAAAARLRALVGDGRGSQQMHCAGQRLTALAGMTEGIGDPRLGAGSGFASLYLAEVLYESDALDEAQRLLSQFLPLIKDAGIPDQLIASHLLYARILRAGQNGNDALQILLELEQLGMQRRLPRIVDSARLEQARFALLDGDMEAARTLLALVGTAPAWHRRDMQMVSNDIDSPLLGTLRWQVHNGQAAAALPLLKEHLQDAYARGRIRYALRVKVVYALSLACAGQRNPALRTLRETLQDASVEGFVRIFKDEGPAVLALVGDMLDAMQDLAGAEHTALRRFAQQLVLAKEAVALPKPDLLQPPPPLAAGGGIDSDLTARELEVLELLAQGYGNQAIAERLFVSVTTVKTHLRNINVKLGARSRTEAISIARRLSVIS